jgi:hypothetical protein
LQAKSGSGTGAAAAGVTAGVTAAWTEATGVQPPPVQTSGGGGEVSSAADGDSSCASGGGQRKNRAKEQRCKCGSRDHVRTTARKRPLNPNWSGDRVRTADVRTDAAPHACSELPWACAACTYAHTGAEAASAACVLCDKPRPRE